MKIGVLGNLTKLKTTQVLDDLVALLQSFGYETTTFAPAQTVCGVDVLIVLGGDGAILHAAVTAAKNGLLAGFPQDTVSSYVERALAAITESDPRGVNDEVLGEIFSKFCVGK